MENEGWGHHGVTMVWCMHTSPGKSIAFGHLETLLVWRIQRKSVLPRLVTNWCSLEEVARLLGVVPGCCCMGSGRTGLWVEVVELIQK